MGTLMVERGEPGFAADAYQRARAIWKGQKPRRTRRGNFGGDDEAHQNQPFGRGRDPKPLGDLLEASARDMGWTAEIAQLQLIADWPRLVGDTVAPHTQVVGLNDGVLNVQCDSTAWATELRRLRSEILTRIIDEYPDVVLRELRFLAPGAPSWRHGRRTVPGRGPRDTYG